MNHQLARLKRARTDRQVGAVCETLVSTFGGLEGLAKHWQETLTKAMSKGGQPALRHLEAVIRLIQHCEQDKPDFSQMSDEELEATLASLQ